MEATWPKQCDLRGWLALLEERGELRRMTRRIDADQDVAAVLEHADGRYAVAFDAVRDASYPLVGNTVPTRRHYALAMGCPESGVVDRLADAVRTPRPCSPTASAEAPVTARHDTEGDLLGDLPLPVQHEHDAGRYFTSALVLVRDPRTGKANLSINRLQVTGAREARALMLPGRLRAVFAEHEAAGEDLPVALCVGVDPLLALASQSPPAADLDDLEVASALHPEPLEVTYVDGLDVPVPARAEMVLTGAFRAGRRADEGPFGEYPRTYGPGGPAPVLELSARWSREDACLQTVLSGGREHFWLGGLPREARLVRTLRAAGVDVSAVRLTEGGSCRMHAVISLRSRGDGTARHAAMAAFTAVTTLKLAVVVDDDVDVFDDEQVEWAVATRMQADRDLFVVPRTTGSSLDPSADAGTTAKMAMDATVPAGDRERFARMRSKSSNLAAHLSELEEG
ncbi:MAG: UbiD family decarboxylase [Streptomyces sp.]|uniref:UbiD family decarboxylase n=1 Tax=Streptomyces sp. TaxID=1931 RepID=UPI003D6B77BE